MDRFQDQATRVRTTIPDEGEPTKSLRSRRSLRTTAFRCGN